MPATPPRPGAASIRTTETAQGNHLNDFCASHKFRLTIFQIHCKFDLYCSNRGSATEMLQINAPPIAQRLNMFKTNEQFRPIRRRQPGRDRVAADCRQHLAGHSRAPCRPQPEYRPQLRRGWCFRRRRAARRQDVQGFVSLQQQFAKPGCRKGHRLLAQRRYESPANRPTPSARSPKARASSSKKTFSNAVEQSLKSAPAGSETVVAAVKSALAQPIPLTRR